MNHTATDKEIQPERNLWAEMIIQTMEDLNPNARGIDHNGTWRSWTRLFRPWLDTLKLDEDLVKRHVRFIGTETAVKLWARGTLEHYAMGRWERYNKDASRQRSYNVRVKRWLDRVYAYRDPRLTGLIVTENPGMIIEQAKNAGMESAVAEMVEQRVMDKAAIQTARLFLELGQKSQPMSARRFKWRTYRNEILKEDVS
jgi:hypothetical protein